MGFGISAYHAALQRMPSLEVVPCGAGPPCSGRYVAVFGFVTIPVMAGAAFALIATLLLLIRIVHGSEAASGGDDDAPEGDPA